MRVALLTSNAQSGDAIGNHIAEKLAFFLDQGADVRVFVESDRDLHPGLRPYCRLLAAHPQGEGWAYLCDCDLVVVEFSQAYSLLGLLPLLARARPRILIDYHGITPPDLWPGPKSEALKEGVRTRGLVWCGDGVVVHSRFTRRELQAPTAYPDERIYPLGLVVDREIWQPGPPEHDWRRQLGVGAAPIMLFVGRLAPNKRVPILVDLLQRRQDVHAVIVGADADVYRRIAEECERRAEESGVSDRLHILGRLSNTELRDAYRSADVFVMPSLHEGFCVPVIEAMACGLPVVASRAAALPETVSDAGLTFMPDDVDDLARQIGRVLSNNSCLSENGEPGALATGACQRGFSPVADAPGSPLQIKNLAVAIVAPRYGVDFAGGAETSLRTITEALHASGHRVEVFTTCSRGERCETNDLPEGTVEIADVRVHRRSTALLSRLHERAAEFDAIIVGPYQFSLSAEIARAFPEQAFVLPCFHDEPAARLPEWRETFGAAAGILYHSAEEKAFAEIELGLNHPGSQVCGTFIDASTLGNPQRGRTRIGSDRPYLVYCGRYLAEKGLPVLIDLARNYSRAHPDRFTFVFMGEGSIAIPREPWARDLGFVAEADKRDILAGAAALVHWSENESLSLAALEAWTQGTPLICNRRCSVLAGHLKRCGGGAATSDADAFSAALDDLWANPESWQAQGRAGQEYVQANYGSREAFVHVLENAIAEARLPLIERMRRRGLERAKQFDRAAWRRQFGAAVEAVLDTPARDVVERIEVTPRGESRSVSTATPTVLIPIRATNQGAFPAAVDGPARTVFRAYIRAAEGGDWKPGGPDVPLPEILMPGQTRAAVMMIDVPAIPGEYRVAFRAGRFDDMDNSELQADNGFTLKVTDGPAVDGEHCIAPMLELVQNALGQAHLQQRLPDDYTDVSLGRFARLKLWIKQKLLGNFKRAYVDVLSRQQSEVNRQVLTAIHELSECCRTLDHARKISVKGEPLIHPSLPLRGSAVGDEDGGEGVEAVRTPHPHPLSPEYRGEGSRTTTGSPRVVQPSVDELQQHLRGLTEQLTEVRVQYAKLYESLKCLHGSFIEARRRRNSA